MRTTKADVISEGLKNFHFLATPEGEAAMSDLARDRINDLLEPYAIEGDDMIDIPDDQVLHVRESVEAAIIDAISDYRSAVTPEALLPPFSSEVV